MQVSKRNAQSSVFDVHAHYLKTVPVYMVCNNGFNEMKQNNTTIHSRQRINEIAFLKQVCNDMHARRAIHPQTTIKNFILKFFGNRDDILKRTAILQFCLPHIKSSLDNSDIVRFIHKDSPIQVCNYFQNIDDWYLLCKSNRCPTKRAYLSSPIRRKIKFNCKKHYTSDFLLHAGSGYWWHATASTIQPKPTKMDQCPVVNLAVISALKLKC